MRPNIPHRLCGPCSSASALPQRVPFPRPHLRVCPCVACVCVRAGAQVEFTAGGAPREWGSAGATHEAGCAWAAARSASWGRRGWLRLRGGAFDTLSPYSVAELRAIAKVSSRRARARASLCCARQLALCCQRRRVFGLVVCSGCPHACARISLFCLGADGRRECRLHQQPPSVWGPSRGLGPGFERHDSSAPRRRHPPHGPPVPAHPLQRALFMRVRQPRG